MIVNAFHVAEEMEQETLIDRKFSSSISCVRTEPMRFPHFMGSGSTLVLLYFGSVASGGQFWGHWDRIENILMPLKLSSIKSLKAGCEAGIIPEILHGGTLFKAGRIKTTLRSFISAMMPCSRKTREPFYNKQNIWRSLWSSLKHSATAPTEGVFFSWLWLWSWS